jgi:RecJ-like exonuclease
MGLIRFHHEVAARSAAHTGGPDIMTDYEHVPCPACHGRGHIPVEEAAKIAGVGIEEARRAGREAEKQEAAELERRVADAAARLTSLEGT